MNTNNGGVTNVDVLSVGALYINGQRLRDIVLGLQSEITLNQEQITEMNAFLARLDLQITDPNILTLTKHQLARTQTKHIPLQLQRTPNGSSHYSSHARGSPTSAGGKTR